MENRADIENFNYFLRYDREVDADYTKIRRKRLKILCYFPKKRFLAILDEKRIRMIASRRKYRAITVGFLSHLHKS